LDESHKTELLRKVNGAEEINAFVEEHYPGSMDFIKKKYWKSTLLV
jgi:hypothetical protein